MGLQKELPELVNAGIISEDTAGRIRHYYRDKQATTSASRSIAAFAIIGATLVGLGIILIVAHNWDQFDRFTKSVFSFLPLVLGQVFCGFALFKKQPSTAFREGSATFLLLAVGATISLISQVYHIMGGLSGFLLTWALLALPIIYVMRSSMSALFYLIGITAYASDIGYWTYPNTPPFLYLPLFAAVIPFYVYRIRKSPGSNFNGFLHWFVPLSFIICLGAFSFDKEELMYVAYLSLFGLCYLLGRLINTAVLPRILNGYRLTGISGTVIILLILSFQDSWNDINRDLLTGTYPLRSLEMLFVTIITFAAAYACVKASAIKAINWQKPFAHIFWVFLFIFILGAAIPVAGFALVNLLVLLTGILIVREGAEEGHLGILNFGMLVVAALVTCRFFDSHLPFFVRGILFMLVGAGFIAANVITIKNRRKNES
ncbi:DUF2157 domain-containing protein [Roseivirga sp. BDSF3-8]|uniref:DUF2157 domain-containing protein n=1 Tax=Roseivirga sp. BDSF3-8 TaxID=3241598 RepID=UPI0035323BA5